MSERLTAASEALKAGRSAEAIEHLIAALRQDPARPAPVYRTLLSELYRARRPVDGDAWSKLGIEQHPKDVELWNIRGVFLRQLKRYPEARSALETAAQLDPRSESVQVNLGNVLLDSGDAVRAEPVFSKLVRQNPRNAEFQRQLGRSLLKQGKYDPALVRFRQATALNKQHVDAWLDLIGALIERGRRDEAERIIDKALAANPAHPRIVESRVILLRRAGQPSAAVAYVRELLQQHADAHWLFYQLSQAIGDSDREQANVALRRALELDPGNFEYRMGLIESLERTRTGDEGANIEEAYQLAREVMAARPLTFSPGHLKILFEVFVRVVALDELDRLGSVASIGRAWGESGRHTALLRLMPRVVTTEDRLALLEDHRVWGQHVEAAAAHQPLRRPKRAPGGGKIRLGFMSSDLRKHPVAYFAEPLFEHIDERFEVFCYSYYHGKEDSLQAWVASKVTGFRWNPEISARDAAQVIADDQLDYLIELGGSTQGNKLDVMAWRPAPLQGSWLGYPHSAGLEAIDDLIVDPYLRPESSELMMEQPLEMPASWIAMGRLAFPDAYEIDRAPPHARNGHITFGTANNPYKYSRAMLDAWARVVAAVPDSRFMIVRPEGNAASFRRNIAEAFAARGVAADRLEFVSIRGAHIPHYNRIDIALDAFPQTGGTTTCEAAWMGVPTVSLTGPAIYERLSYSILTNAGLGDLCTRTIEDYVATAVALAADRERLTDLRRTLRDRLRASPLGQTRQFAADFYEMIARRVEAARP